MERPTISIEDFCIALYCAEMRPDALRPDNAARIAFTARSVPDEDHEAYYAAEFEAVCDFNYRSEVREPGWGPCDRLELSVVELKGEPGSWEVWFNPWYLHEFEFRCGRIRLNGAEVVGRGKHVQDELPKRLPNVPPYSAGAA